MTFTLTFTLTFDDFRGFFLIGSFSLPFLLGFLILNVLIFCVVGEGSCAGVVVKLGWHLDEFSIECNKSFRFKYP